MARYEIRLTCLLRHRFLCIGVSEARASARASDKITIEARRAEGLSGPLAGLLQFLNPALDDLALERRHLIQKDDPVTVIRFVQHAAGSQFRTVQLKLLAVDVMGAHDCPQVALNVEEDSRERETAFVAVLF